MDHIGALRFKVLRGRPSSRLPAVQVEAIEAIETIEAEQLPLALADLHRELTTDAHATLTVFADVDRDATSAEADAAAIISNPIGGSYTVADIIDGAGFISEPGLPVATTTPGRAELILRRRFSLADSVGPGMRMLICGLNPSIYSAEVGIGFGRPGNRFWPAAVAAGLVAEPGDPRKALVDARVGMTDLAKRPTRRADELSNDEYLTGLARVERLVDWLQPTAVCFVGLAGWRATVDRKAQSGWQADQFGQTPVYLMPSTSGLNASSQLPDLVFHLREALNGRR